MNQRTFWRVAWNFLKQVVNFTPSYSRQVLVSVTIVWNRKDPSTPTEWMLVSVILKGWAHDWDWPRSFHWRRISDEQSTNWVVVWIPFVSPQWPPYLLLDTSLYAGCTVRPNKMKTQESGAEKGLLQSHARRQVARGQRTLNSLKGFSKTLLKARWRRGVVANLLV